MLNAIFVRCSKVVGNDLEDCFFTLCDLGLVCEWMVYDGFLRSGCVMNLCLLKLFE